MFTEEEIEFLKDLILSNKTVHDFVDEDTEKRSPIFRKLREKLAAPKETEPKT